jgi:hypothetical protein
LLVERCVLTPHMAFPTIDFKNHKGQSHAGT